MLGKGAQVPAQAFWEGFSEDFPLEDLQAFTADELVMLYGNADEDWSIESTLLFLILLFRSKTSLIVLSEALNLADRELLPTESTQNNVDESERSNPQSVRVSICRRWGMYAYSA